MNDDRHPTHDEIRTAFVVVLCILGALLSALLAIMVVRGGR